MGNILFESGNLLAWRYLNVYITCSEAQERAREMIEIVAYVMSFVVRIFFCIYMGKTKVQISCTLFLAAKVV